MPTPPEPPRAVTLLSLGMKVAALGGLTVFVLVAIMASPEPQSLATRQQPELAQLLRTHRCTPLGVEAATHHASAIVRTPAGRLAHVPYAVGMQMHDGIRKGTLLAVCADPVTR